MTSDGAHRAAGGAVGAATSMPSWRWLVAVAVAATALLLARDALVGGSGIGCPAGGLTVGGSGRAGPLNRGGSAAAAAEAALSPCPEPGETEPCAPCPSCAAPAACPAPSTCPAAPACPVAPSCPAPPPAPPPCPSASTCPAPPPCPSQTGKPSPAAAAGGSGAAPPPPAWSLSASVGTGGSATWSVFTPCPLGAPVVGASDLDAALGPLPVDLVLKSFDGHAAFLLPLFKSLELFWASYARLVLVVDSPREAMITAVAPPHAIAVVEPLGGRGGGYFGQMWSNLWMDAYTASPIIGLLDSDVVFQYRVGWDTLTVADPASPVGGRKLVLRYLRCPAGQAAPGDAVPRATASVAPSPGGGTAEWERFEGDLGCLYRDGVEHLLKLPYYGNFMVQAPLLVPRTALAGLRAHVSRAHGGRDFDDVMQDIAARGLPFSQHSALGNFLLHTIASGGAAAAALGLDGSARAGRLSGLHFVPWGRAEMFPHVGRHIGWEDEGPLKKHPERYVPYAMGVLRKGACAAYANVEARLCDTAVADAMGNDLYRFQTFGPGPGHVSPPVAYPLAPPACYVPPRLAEQARTAAAT